MQVVALFSMRKRSWPVMGPAVAPSASVDVDQVEDVFVAGVDTGADVGQPGHVAGVGVVVAEEFVADVSGAGVAGLGGSDAFL